MKTIGQIAQEIMASRSPCLITRKSGKQIRVEKIIKVSTAIASSDSGDITISDGTVILIDDVAELIPV